VFRYRLHSPDGDDLGEAYAQMIHPDEEIIAGDNQRFRVIDVVPFEEEDESPFVGLLQVVAVNPELPVRAEPDRAEFAVSDVAADGGRGDAELVGSFLDVQQFAYVGLHKRNYTVARRMVSSPR
jgi:hypothetical protein